MSDHPHAAITAPVRRRARALAAVLMTAVVAGCTAGPSQDSAGAPIVVATTSMIGDLARDVLADTDAVVEVLLEPGMDPHAYAPSGRDARRLREADLVLANGLGLEASLEDVLDATAAEGVLVVELGPMVDPLVASESGDEHEEETAEEHAEHGAFDPHVWMDPVRVASMAVAIAGAYAQVSMGEAADAGEQSNRVRDRYLALADELAAQIETIPVERRVMVTNHDAFSYLGERFGLATDLAVIPGLSTQSEPSPAAFSRLVAAMEATGMDVVFTEVESSDRLAQALADQVGGVEVVALFSGSLGPPGSGAETLEGMLRLDVERIVAALR